MRAKYFVQLSRQSHLLLASGSALLASLAMGWWTASFEADFTAYTAWHHWGAYLSPVDLLLSGGVPYHDFPVQYGVGPTLLLAANCGNDCWTGMFHVVLIGNAFYTTILCMCAALVTAGMARNLRLLAVLAMFVAATCWTAFPAAFSSAMATPSATSLRFFPLLLQLLFILHSERKADGSMWVGHAIWLTGAIWSIETAIFVTVLWWPWLALRASRQISDKSGIVRFLARFALTAASALAAVIAAMLVLFRLYFGIWPDAETIFAYFNNPPGPLPPNPVGPLALVVILSLIAIRRLLRDGAAGDGVIYACLLTMAAAFSYYLSRSHDNNILNLLPFALLVALSVLRPSEVGSVKGEFDKGFAMLVPVAVIAFLALFNYELWTKIAREGQLGEFGPRVILQQFAPAASDPDPIISRDALELIDLARRNSGEAPLFFASRAVMPMASSGRAWTSVNSIANYSPLPPEMVKSYIARSAARFDRPGWLIVEDGQYENWPKYFSTHYDVRAVSRKGPYLAYLLSPKTGTNR
jgi:hypothetical protein